MALQSAPKLLHWPHSVFSASDRLIFADFVGFSKRHSHRRRIASSSSRKFLSVPRNVAGNGAVSSVIKDALDLERVNTKESSSGRKVDQQVVNLEDIIGERGACGVGFIANLDNKGSHHIVKDALIALGCMEHPGGCGSDNDSGDGSGIMTSIPWELFDH